MYTGQLDLICDTAGTEMWMQRLKWSAPSQARMFHVVLIDHGTMLLNRQDEHDQFLQRSEATAVH